MERGSARKFMIVCGWSIRAEKKATDKSRARREERAYRFRKAAKVCGVTRVGGNKAEVVTLLGVLDGSVKCMIVVR